MSSLYLYPAHPTAPSPDAKPVIVELQRQGLIGVMLSPARWLAGEHFLQLITFAGCSPHIRLEPDSPGSLDFTHISLEQYPSAVLRYAAQRTRPRCPACRAPVKDWKSQVARWQSQPLADQQCAACGKSAPVWALDWRGYGLVGRMLVEIHRIYPGEALPNDDLLDGLALATGQPWLYAWADQST